MKQAYLVVQTMVDVAPKQAIDEDGLPLEVVTEGARPQTAVEETTNLGDVPLTLMAEHKVVVTSGSNIVETPAVGGCDLLHQSISASHGPLWRMVQEEQKHQQMQVSVNLRQKW